MASKPFTDPFPTLTRRSLFRDAGGAGPVVRPVPLGREVARPTADSVLEGPVCTEIDQRPRVCTGADAAKKVAVARAELAATVAGIKEKVRAIEKRKRGRPPAIDKEPWKTLGMSRTNYYRRLKKKK